MSDRHTHGPDDDDDNNSSNNRKPKAAIVFLPVPQELKDKGVKAVTYARTFISIDYKGKIFTFTAHKEDITKTHDIYEKELDHEVDDVTKREIWFNCIGCNWLKHIYTEEEIQRDVIGAIGGQADAILELAQKNCQQVFKDEYKVAHAAVTINKHLEILPINETRFKHWLRKIVKKEYDVVARGPLLDEVVNTLTSDAEFDGEIRELGLRIAPAPDDNLGLKLRWYYDLTNDEYEFVEITSKGWLIKKNQIIFRRFDHQKAQDYPNASGDYPPDIFDQFLDLLNVKEENRLILKCYIMSLFIPNLPKSVLMVHGEQGTAKSMLEEIIKMLVDPNVVKTLSFPKDVAELVQQLSHHNVTYYDNLSIIPGWISDLLCRATTGSGFSKRRLYTNDQDVVYSLMRAIGFNGINLAATRPDLLDRGLIIQTDTIPKGNRRRMKAIWNRFYSIRPQLLSYILDTLVKVLKWKGENPSLDVIKELPRMADWAEWCEVISRCMGEEDNAFINAYNENINLQIEEVIEGSDLAIAVRELVGRFDEKIREFNGTPTRLSITGCLAVLSFVKKPISIQETTSEIKDETNVTIEVILTKERSEGRLSQAIPPSERGIKYYDIHSLDPKTKEERMIKVENSVNSEAYAELTEAQIRLCREARDNYWIYVVYNKEQVQRVLKFQNPSISMNYSGMDRSTGNSIYVLRPRYP